MKSRQWDQRHALLIGLTAGAATLDALAFLYLGKVFISFQSGNVLFLGLGAGEGNGGLVIRAGVVLALFFAGAAAGSRLIGDRLSPTASPRAELDILAIEGLLLAAFALVWLAIGTPADHPVARVVLLALGAGAMGIQVAFALALKIPNVVTVAVTATLAYLGQRAGEKRDARDPEQPSAALLAGLCAVYAVCAAVIAVLPESSVLALVPLVVLAATVAIDRAQSPAPTPAGVQAVR